MLTSAIKGGVWRRGMAFAVCLMLALAASACGKDKAAGTGEAGAQVSGATTSDQLGLPPGTPPSGRPGDSVRQVQTAAAALDTSGWVLAPPFYAAGDEPFWRLDILDGWFVFQRSGLPEIEAPMTAPTRAGGADVFDSPPLLLTVKREACDLAAGGGDVSAVINFDGNEFDGCAFAGSAGGAGQSGAIIDALTAIDNCLAKLGDPALVTGIYAREGGRTGLGLRTKDGSLYECAAEAGGGEIAFLDQIEPRAAKPYMTSQMRFLRDGVSVATQCDGAENVQAGDKVIGWLLTSKCKF